MQTSDRRKIFVEPKSHCTSKFLEMPSSGNLGEMPASGKVTGVDEDVAWRNWSPDVRRQRVRVAHANDANLKDAHAPWETRTT